MITCVKCGALSEKIDRTWNICRPCRHKYGAAYYAKHRDEYFERNRQYYADNLEKVLEREKKRSSTEHAKELMRVTRHEQYEKHKEKSQARSKLHQAVKEGKVLKPTQCTVVSQVPCKGRIEGHHPDYSKPLDVMWLCPAHHREQHGRRFDLHKPTKVQAELRQKVRGE